MTIRTLLARCRHAQEEIKALHRQIDRLNTQDELRSAQHYRTLLESREREVASDLAELEELIGSLTDTRSRTVMRYYYTMGMNDTQIGEEMELTDEWVRKKRYAAVRGMERRRERESG